jgi:hypothetical protein
MVCTIFADMRMHPFASQLTGFLPPFSSVICAPGISECGIHAVCIPLDELFVDEGDQCAEYHSDVGYISCESISVILTCARPYKHLILCSSRRDQTPFRNFIFMFAPRSWCAGVKNYAKWIFRWDFYTLFIYFINEGFHRASLCSCNLYQHKIGEITRSRCC